MLKCLDICHFVGQHCDIYHVVGYMIIKDFLGGAWSDDRAVAMFALICVLSMPQQAIGHLPCVFVVVNKACPMIAPHASRF